MRPEPKRVISASRRTDIPRYYPDWLAKRLLEGSVEVPLPYGGKRLVSLEPQKVHTLVLWSKDFSRVLADECGVRRALERYDQIFCHFTITGLGGSQLEPRVPPWEIAVEQIPGLVALCGDPRRLVLRFDPIVHWHEHGRVRSNLPFAEPILKEAARFGIKAVKTSFATLYHKVLRRGWEWYEPPREEKLEIARELLVLAEALGLELYSCSDPVLAEAGARKKGCIDGRLLAELHPQRLPAPTARDLGQRPDCSCTMSVDIGSYRMACPGGCLYCYANPVIRLGSRDRAITPYSSSLGAAGCGAEQARPGS